MQSFGVFPAFLLCLLRRMENCSMKGAQDVLKVQAIADELIIGVLRPACRETMHGQFQPNREWRHRRTTNL